MSKICYLASHVTMPDSPDRRSDAYEHDYTIAAIEPALSQRGIELSVLCWDAPDVDWAEFDMVIIGTTWDYWDRHEAFLARLALIESQTQLHNPAELVRWNSHKGYLRELTQMGCKTIPTLWFETFNAAAMAESFAVFGPDIVAKRQVGAGASGQFRLRHGDALPQTPHAMMVQPFLSTIQTEGEYSFLFIDGQFSHALVKKAKAGDYRIQSTYGGYETAISPPAPDLAAAHAVLAHLDMTPLYARVDMVRAEDGDLCLMEVELIEPYLYPEQGPNLGSLLAQAVHRRLQKT